MSGVIVKTRSGKHGKRWLVYYRVGGRAFKEKFAGSFTTKREATIRRDLIAGELAALRDPQRLLANLKKPEAGRARLGRVWDSFIESRVDVSASTAALYRNSRDRWLPLLGERTDPATLEPGDVIRGIAALAAGDDDTEALTPATITLYLSTLRQVLDFHGLEPNPARSRRVKLPASPRIEIDPPSTAEWTEIRKHARKRSLLTLRLIECLGLRVNEACGLTWGDVDLVEGQVRVARSKTASGRRWLPVPDELLDEIAGLRAPEDRLATGRVLGVEHGIVRYDLERACVAAGCSHHGPHDLRHRRISLWYRHGFDPVRVRAWAGHARASMGLDVYGHVILDPAGDEWGDHWRAAYTRPGAAPVRHSNGLEG